MEGEDQNMLMLLSDHVEDPRVRIKNKICVSCYVGFYVFTVALIQMAFLS